MFHGVIQKITLAQFFLRHGVYTPCFKKVVHQAHIDNLVNSQRIFKILSLTHSAENYENLLKID